MFINSEKANLMADIVNNITINNRDTLYNKS